MTGLHIGRISGAVVGLFMAAAFGAALAEARRINLSGDLTRGLDELFTVPAPAPDVEVDVDVDAAADPPGTP
jgi:hypothetical protein